MSRSVEEWIGKDDDTAIPPRVKARVFERHNGRCHISGRKIMAGERWDCDHVLALINGGKNRESNLAPALHDKHVEKTAEDVGLKSKVTRQNQKHLGIYPKGKGFGNLTRKFDGSIGPKKSRRSTSAFTTQREPG